MQKNDGGVLYSASDLSDFLVCRHLIHLKRISLDTYLKKAETDEQVKLLQDKGIEHENAFLNSLRKQNKRIAEITVKGVSRTKQIADTLAAMRDGADVIYQAVLLQPPFFGISDFLYRVPNSSNLGSWSYEVADTKLSRSPKARHLIQVALYSDMLAVVQGLQPSNTHLVLGNGKQVSFRLTDYFHYMKQMKLRFLAFVYQHAATYPEKCSHCSMCEWMEICQEQWNKDDHMNRVANIRKGDINRLKGAGIFTLADLVQRGDPATNPIPKLGNQEILWRQAKLQRKHYQTGEDLVELKEFQADSKLGFLRLPPADEGDLYFDMEGDPMEEGGLEYLFGISCLENGDLKFRPFWGHDRNQEKKAFEDFIDFVTEHLSCHPNAHIYHYADYENRALKYLMGLHGTREAEVDNLLRNKKLVDLFTVVRHSILTSEPRYSIKNLETFYMKGERSADVKNAGASIIYYEDWRKTKDPNLLEQIRQYNEEDCRSTWLLHLWLMKLRPLNLPWYSAESDERLDEEKATSLNEAEKQREHYQQKLIAGLSEDVLLWGVEDKVKRLLFDLIDFYRREDKPGFWRMFERQEKTEPDLMDDLDCISGLKLDNDTPVFKDKRSSVITYRFLPQEHKLAVSDACQDSKSLQSIGKIYALDTEEGLVQLRVGPSVMKAWEDRPPKMISAISANNHVNKKALQTALLRFIDTYIAGGSKYEVLKAFLRRELPNIAGVTSGDPLSSNGDDASERAVQVIPQMQESCLFLQGPPGTGKTYTGSRAIVALLQQGKRIAVSANSHKAIGNLLSATEKAARDQGFTFKGAKKGVIKNDGIQEGMIEIIDDNSVYDPAYQLLGGTAWAFAHEKADSAFDYLFIDEAGQVSLTNLIAMGVCAKNIVLLGDQMQLGSPLQGDHPGESGQSALDYFLGEFATIPPEHGIFLGVTRRMHPDVCEFISDAVYEGRLHAAPENSNQMLVLGETAHPSLKQTGISFVEIDHDECVQSSLEEAILITKIVESLLGQQYQDKGGGVYQLSKENILVVAPYNAQVRTLRERLPNGIEVGTVDKFQGLEAEVVIISMTTSSGDDLPRNIEFLYDKNRLNVAVSRARSLAIVVANPKLLEVDCKTPEQMALVNTLCWLREYGKC
jgi:uncharacterized protein